MKRFAVLLCLVASVAWGENLELGAATWTLAPGFEAAAPASHEVTGGQFGAGDSVSIAAHRADGLNLRLVRFAPRKPVRWPKRPAAVLSGWQANHGCTAKIFTPTVVIAAKQQLAFGGTCEGGDSYLLRLLVMADGVYELHADISMMTPSRVNLARELEAFASAIAWR